MEYHSYDVDFFGNGFNDYERDSIISVQKTDDSVVLVYKVQTLGQRVKGGLVDTTTLGQGMRKSTTLFFCNYYE